MARTSARFSVAAAVALVVGRTTAAPLVAGAPSLVHDCGCSPPAVGLGYDIAATHASVSAAFPNGTTLDLGTVPAPIAFTAFYRGTHEPAIARIGDCIQHDGPLSLRKIWEGLRNFVFLRGERPVCQARADVTVFGDFVAAITAHATEKLAATGDPVTEDLVKNVVITSEDLSAMPVLDERVLLEVLGGRFAGVAWDATIPKDEAVFRAAIGAVGQGDEVADEQETPFDEEDEDELVLSIDYSADALTVKTTTYDAQTHELIASHGSVTVDADELPALDGEGHCERVRRVAELVQARIADSLPCMTTPADVRRLVVTGDWATTEGVLDGIEVALGMAGVDTELMIEVRAAHEAGRTQGSNVAARGAAGRGARSGMCGMVVVIEEVVVEGEEIEAEETKEDEVVNADVVVVSMSVGPVIVAEIATSEVAEQAQPGEEVTPAGEGDATIQVEWETLEDNVELYPGGDKDTSEQGDYDEELKV